MSSQSEFVRQVHLDSVRHMLREGTNTEAISAHLKRVWCDEEDIAALINEAKSTVRPQPLSAESC